MQEHGAVHGIPVRRSEQAGRLGRAAATLLLAALAGCNAQGGFDPGAVLHRYEGGVVAQQNPAPPGLDQKYPSLHTVPRSPDIPTPALQQSLRDQLLAQRERVRRINLRDPLPVQMPRVPPPPAATPGQAAPPAGAATAQAGSSATLAAADATPRAPQRAGAPPRAASPGFPPLPDTAPALTGPPVLIGDLPATGALPEVPAGPPRAPADLADVPTDPAPTPPPPVPAFVPPAQRGTAVAFSPGAAAFAPRELGKLRTLADTHRGATFDITGHGDTYADTAQAQAAAVSLGLQRAAAVARVLVASGVPDRSIRIGADAFGDGASVQLQ